VHLLQNIFYCPFVISIISIIIMDLQEVGWGGGCGDWMEMAQDRDRWRALVGTVRNFRVT
jgi:hypothetical protein